MDVGRENHMETGRVHTPDNTRGTAAGNPSGTTAGNTPGNRPGAPPVASGSSVFVRPGMAAKEIVAAVRSLGKVALTSTGMRDAGQSDFKNRLRLHDLSVLSPLYNEMGLFSTECHGGARWHVGIMNRRENPFDELRQYREQMPNVLLQTLVRETSLFGYRPYPKNVIETVIPQVDVDVWRCFSFLNEIRNMKTVAETVMKSGKLFVPALSFTQADWADDAYYAGLVKDIVALCGGVDEIILCFKDMAGVGVPSRIRRLVSSIKEQYPDLVVQYHRHSTDGLALPALLAAAQAGASILDVEEDSLVRFYGQPPMLAVQACLEDAGIPVHLDRPLAERAVSAIRPRMNQYDWAESPVKGTDHTVLRHRMPGGAFPSSFEQAEKGGFLDRMPDILEFMALYNQMIHYFDVTPGSQITWTTCSGIVNRYAKEHGETGVRKLLVLVTRFVEEVRQDFEAMNEEEQTELLALFRNAPGDFKQLLRGQYGALPGGWPADWVYQSAFGSEWEEMVRTRQDQSPLEFLPEEDLDRQKEVLADHLGRVPTTEEFILYLMHPKDALEYFGFVDTYGQAPWVLPTGVWRNGLKKPGDRVEFQLGGKPYCIELLSIGAEHEGIIHVVMRVNNITRVYEIKTPKAKGSEVRMAGAPNHVGSPVNGTVWRLGNATRGPLNVGDIVRKGEEIANIEAMKMETAVAAPFDATVTEIVAHLNQVVQERQLIIVLEKA